MLIPDEGSSLGGRWMTNERGSDGLGLMMGGWEAAAFFLGIWNVVEPW